VLSRAHAVIDAHEIRRGRREVHAIAAERLEVEVDARVGRMQVERGA
jgi:hypothetical protein